MLDPQRGRAMQVMQWQIYRPDHQDAIVLEKLKLLNCFLKVEPQKQAVISVLNTDAWLSGSFWFCTRSLGGLLVFVRRLN